MGCPTRMDAYAGHLAATADATADANAAPQIVALKGFPMHMEADAGNVGATADNAAPQKVPCWRAAGAARLASALRSLQASVKPPEARSSAALPSPMGHPLTSHG